MVPTEALNWVRKTAIAGKVGYAYRRRDIPSSPRALRCQFRPPRKTRTPPICSIQWLNSADVSRQRVQLPYTLRDPFRDSHYTDPGYLAFGKR